MKKFVLLMIAMMFVLAACGGTENTTSESGNESEDNEAGIKLRIAWWGGQERHDRTLEIIEIYEERNPHIEISAEYSGFDGYFDRLSTQFAAGDAPDIIQYGGNLNDYVPRGVVLELDEYIGNDLDVSLHDDTMIEAATFDDKLYGVSLGSNAWGVLLNKTLFEEAGVPLPSEDWTWEGFEETAVQLSESLDGVAGTEYFDHNGFGIFIDQKGKLLHEDGVLGIEEQDVVDWFELWEDLRVKGAVVNPEIQAASSTTPEQSMIVAGQVAMQLTSSNQLRAYTSSTQDELVFHTHPQMDGRSGVALRPSQFMSGYSETEYPEEVAKFLDFMVNDEEATEILGNERGAPVNSEVREHVISVSDEVDQSIFEYVDLISNTSDSPYVPNLPGYNETEALFQTTSEEIAFDQISVEEGAEQYFTELEEVLERNR